MTDEDLKRGERIIEVGLSQADRELTPACNQQTVDALPKVEPAPWFATHNPYAGIPGPICIYQVVPFPADQFCAFSPWAHHAIIAHCGVEPYAKADGFDDVTKYLKGMIADAASRDDFCTSCPNMACTATATQ